MSSKAGTFELGQGELLLGRSRSCQLVLPDPSVSRSHVLVLVEGEGVRVKDLDSSNGTYVNGQLIQEETALEIGDRLSVGETELTLETLDDGKSSTPVLLPRLDLGEGPTRSAQQGAETDSSFDREAIQEAFRRLAPPDPEPDDAAGQADDAGSAPVVRPSASDAEMLDATGVTPYGRSRRSAAQPASPPPAEPAAEKALASGELLPSLEGLDELGSIPQAPAADAADLRPAQPPASSLSGSREAQPAGGFPPAAGFWVRAVAATFDWLLITLIAVTVSLFGGGPWRAEGSTLLWATFFALAVLVPVFGWSIWGTTPGKRLLGLYVLSVESSGTIGVGRALLRIAGYVVSLLALGGGFLMVGFTASRRGLHDVIAGTYVARRD